MQYLDFMLSLNVFRIVKYSRNRLENVQCKFLVMFRQLQLPYLPAFIGWFNSHLLKQIRFFKLEFYSPSSGNNFQHFHVQEDLLRVAPRVIKRRWTIIHKYPLPFITVLTIHAIAII